MKAVLKAFAVLVAVAIVLPIATFVWIGSRGISARAEPGTVETVIARTMRRFAMPRSARDLTNPVPKSSVVLAEGMAHYADHCASCHGNDGSGKTGMGIGLYPKAPDMRLAATQSLSDGELFYIIENGVRLTGMPGWATGTDEGKTATWHLVHFIRDLPRLTPEQIEQMESMNPRSPAEIRQEIEEENFLQGGPEPPAASTPTHNKH